MGSDEDNPRSRYGLSCPVGGQFYICKDSPTRFMGCCDIDPYKNGGICTTSALRSSSFSRGNYGDIPGQDCLVGGAKNWYTCSYNNPPFLGCCLENPCVSGQCHPGNVTAAKLASDEASAAPFLTGGSSSSSSAASSADESKKGGAPHGRHCRHCGRCRRRPGHYRLPGVASEAAEEGLLPPASRPSTALSPS
ncbi:hypothetical protein PG987_014432 [Apiospora arundinis]